MADHKHGSMDITQHQKTFDGFMRYVVRTGIVIVVVLILLALFGA
ncbi:aa3-type cytochrome c oxidase subunit IV [Citreimonas sp.]